MRKVLFAILFGVLLAAPAATAAPPGGPAPDPAADPVSAPALVEAPHAISVLQLVDARRTGAVEIGTRPGTTRHVGGGGGVDPLSCGACINTCWSVTGRNGPSDWSGHAYLYTHVNWCGNGAQVTYAAAWPTYDQTGWFRIGNTYGPWFSGGCLGCGSIRTSAYMLWTESIPVLGIDHNGTTWLNIDLTAYGASSASG
ncbi:MAG TPA: hypothetical protein VFL60_02195 [Gaiellaceae bacterium]|nr:hypothetical protein [Gaiellaceae bacterium]